MTNVANSAEPPPSPASVMFGQSTVQTALVDAARRWIEQLCNERLTSEQLLTDGYVSRLRECLKHHWSQLNAILPLDWDETIRRLEAGLLHYGRVAANVVRDVVLAQAMEKGRPAAVAAFDRDYMPLVRAIGRQYYDQRAIDCAEGLLAELMVRRDDRPPRIATYRGQTPLVDWVRTVATRAMVAAVRSRTAASLGEAPEVAWSPPAESSECRELVTPLLVRAVSTVEKREIVILQMLAEGQASQRDLALRLKLNPGTITRRRQRAMQAIYVQIQKLTAASSRTGRIAECLELVLAGNDPVLRREFAESLAAALRKSGDADEGSAS